MVYNHGLKNSLRCAFYIADVKVYIQMFSKLQRSLSLSTPRKCVESCQLSHVFYRCKLISVGFFKVVASIKDENRD